MEDEFGNKILGKLSKEQYWEWKYLVADSFLANEKIKAKSAHYSLLEKDLEIQKLRCEMYKSVIRAEQDKLQLVKENLETFYNRVEKENGFNMRNSVIDEYSLEVKILPEDIKNSK